MVLAITSLGGSNAGKDITQENILAANTYAFYQAKSIRQTTLKVAAADMELQLLREPTMNAAAKEATQKKIEDYKKTIDRYESEPATQEGKKELMVRAKEHEAIRDHAIRQDPWFDYAEGALQIAIVLLSVSIVAGLPLMYWAGTCLGVLGALSAFNGFFLFI
jgi:AICAR transformylase/IMP cyclohydrolase PurH